jgi:hypothetical protein
LTRSRSGQLEQNVLLAGDALELIEQLPLHLALGMSRDAMDGFDQQIDQAIGERTAAQVCEGGKGGQPQRLGMPAQLVWRLDRDPLAKTLNLMRAVPDRRYRPAARACEVLRRHD